MSVSENNATVVKFEQLPDCLFRIWIRPDWDGSSVSWKPGQFLRLGVLSETATRKTLRAMTIIDVQDGVFEFYMVAVSGGVTSPRVANLTVGQRCCIEPNITGNFTLQHLPNKTNPDIWMMGTGTGIAPYLAMLKHDVSILKQCSDIILVHSVRKTAHLCYQQEIQQYAKQFRAFQYVPVVTSEPGVSANPNVLTHHIQELLQTKALEQLTNRSFTSTNSIVMLCGQPGMIKDSISFLQQQGLTKHRRRTPGNILSERYF